MTSPRPPRSTAPAVVADGTIDRRTFITVAGIGAGLLMSGCASDEEIVPGLVQRRRLPLIGRSSTKVVVIGAGAFGGWTAYHLRRAGAEVTLVDIWGAGNSRSTSGDETRGVRSSYGERDGGELWMLWAREAISRWKQWDEEWSRDMKVSVYHTTGDVIMRADWDTLTTKTKALWEKHKIPHEVLKPEELRKRWPVFATDDITVAITEPDAGVVRARRATQIVAGAFEKIGGKSVIGRAHISRIDNGKVDEVTLDSGERLTADVFVFACGPWLAKTFPELLGDKMRAPMGYVSYFNPPNGDKRFSHPNFPSFNFPGVTGWAALPVDSRGLRVRGGSRNLTTAGTSAPTGTTGRGATISGGGVAGQPAGTTPAQRMMNQAPPDPAQMDPDLSNRWPDPARLEGPRNFLAQRIPLMKDAPLNETRSCHYEISSSNNFIVDKHPQLSNVWIAGGGNAEGFKFGPVIGDYIAQRVMGDEGDGAVLTAFKLPVKGFDPTPAPPPMTADTSRKRGPRQP